MLCFCISKKILQKNWASVATRDKDGMCLPLSRFKFIKIIRDVFNRFIDRVPLRSHTLAIG